VTPERLLWASYLSLVAAFVFTVASCGSRKPTPEEATQIALVGACEARVLVQIEKADTRQALCDGLKTTTDADPCKSFLAKVVGRVCAP
jgi:hypothetical protein